MLNKAQVVCLAACSRLLVLILAVVLRDTIHNSDTTGQLRTTQCLPPATSRSDTGSAGWLGSLAAGFQVWDTVHFLQIAQCGYEVEQSHAFFPLLPGVLRLLGSDSESSQLLAGLLMSNLSMIVSALLLHRLSRVILQETQRADLAVILYCFNPASIFYSAVYTESLYAMLTFGGLFYLHLSKPWRAAVLFSLSAATRSNGITSCWFQLWYQLLLSFKGPHSHRPGVASGLLKVAGCVCLTALPMAAFQLYGYIQFCVGTDSKPAWCMSRVPYLYGHVQEKYWNVGLFRSYRWQQAPNFLLAAPMLWLSFQGCSSCFAHALPHCTKAKPHGSAGKLVKIGYHSWAAAPYVIHWAFMAITAALIMNVQVATRFCSSCPALYWYAGELILRHRCRWIWWYFFGYLVLGCLLFPNWFPWV